jgi:hypothetical protein
MDERGNRFKDEWAAYPDVVAVERITLSESVVTVVILSDGSRALLKDDIVPLLEREKRHTRKLLRTRYPEHCKGNREWFMTVKDTKCLLSSVGLHISEAVFPLLIVIDLLRYYTSFRGTKLASLLKELEEYSARPYEPYIPESINELNTAPPVLDKFTESVVCKLSEALANCKDDGKRSEVVSIVQSLITLL